MAIEDLKLRSTYRTQRLEAPEPSSMAVDRAFGGGMISMSEEGWKLMYQYCRLSYMGAAEYEFGTLAETMNALVTAARNKELISFAEVIGPPHHHIDGEGRRR